MLIDGDGVFDLSATLSAVYRSTFPLNLCCILKNLINRPFPGVKVTARAVFHPFSQMPSDRWFVFSGTGGLWGRRRREVENEWPDMHFTLFILPFSYYLFGAGWRSRGRTAGECWQRRKLLKNGVYNFERKPFFLQLFIIHTSQPREKIGFNKYLLFLGEKKKFHSLNWDHPCQIVKLLSLLCYFDEVTPVCWLRNAFGPAFFYCGFCAGVDFIQFLSSIGVALALRLLFQTVTHFPPSSSSPFPPPPRDALPSSRRKWTRNSFANPINHSFLWKKIFWIIQKYFLSNKKKIFFQFGAFPSKSNIRTNKS